jgi:hypothetical protein
MMEKIQNVIRKAQDHAARLQGKYIQLGLIVVTSSGEVDKLEEKITLGCQGLIPDIRLRVYVNHAQKI